MNRRTKNLEGEQIGEWRVLRFDGYNKNRNATWWCRCSCGVEKSVKAQYLIGGQSTKCPTCARSKKKIIEGTVPDFYWRNVINNTRKRDMMLNISPDEAFQVLVDQNFKCALSGMDIRLSSHATEHLHGETTASLDRINSFRSYEPGNIQWVHKSINFMKRQMSNDDFIDMCKRVVDHLPLPR